MTNYIMDNAGEGERIEQKTDVERTVDQLTRSGLRAGMRVLDLGCAAGTTSRIMADIVGPSGQVIGIDASDSRIADARSRTDAPNVMYDIGLADKLPIGDDVIDFAWSRFLFEYLPDPRSAFHEMIRVTKPGGTVVVSDLDGNCIWHAGMNPELESEIEAALAAFGTRFDPRFGQKIPGMFLSSGLADVEVDIRPYHNIVGAIAEPALSHWKMKLEGVRFALVGLGWPVDRASRLKDGFESHLRNPATFTYSVLVTVKGVKRLV